MNADPVELIENFVARFAFSHGLNAQQALDVRDDVTALRNAFARTDTAKLDSVHVGTYVEWCYERGVDESRLRALEDVGEAFVRYLESHPTPAVAAARSDDEHHAPPSAAQ